MRAVLATDYSRIAAHVKDIDVFTFHSAPVRVGAGYRLGAIEFRGGALAAVHWTSDMSGRLANDYAAYMLDTQAHTNFRWGGWLGATATLPTRPTAATACCGPFCAAPR